MTERTLYFANQTRLHRDSAGRLRSDYDYARYEAWLPYRAGVGRVVVVGRVTSRVDDGGALVEGPGVSVLEVPFYNGPLGFVRHYFALMRFLKRELTDPGALYGAKLPNLVGFLVQRRADQLGAPFIGQVVGDPEDVLRSGVAGLGPILSQTMARPARFIMRRHVSRAAAVSYVTRHELQSKYPAGPHALVLAQSDVVLPGIAPHPRDYAARPPGVPLRIVAVGSHEVRYKGHGTLIDALALLRDRGIATRTTIVGDGRFHDNLVARARQRGLGDTIEFIGHLPSAVQVRDLIAGADLYVMPSLAEGLPRALIEAMATGVACLGTRVGGIPEVLGDDALVEPRDPRALADAVAALVADPSRMTGLASEQLEEARRVANSFSGPAGLEEFLAAVAARDRATP